MNTKNNPNFDYSASYFQTGMVGWHALSFPLITARFEEFSKGKHFGSGLDFGCGDGFYGVFLRRHVERLHGTDVSDCIEDPEKRAAYYEFMQNDLGTMLDTEGNAFDVKFFLLRSSSMLVTIGNL